MVAGYIPESSISYSTGRVRHLKRFPRRVTYFVTNRLYDRAWIGDTDSHRKRRHVSWRLFYGCDYRHAYLSRFGIIAHSSLDVAPLDPFTPAVKSRILDHKVLHFVL